MRAKGAQFIAAITVVAGLAVACGGGVAAPAAAPAGQAPSQPQAQEVVIRATEWKFDPSIVRVKAGQPVRFVFQNWGQEDHDLVLKDLKGQEGDKQENFKKLEGWMKLEEKEHEEAMEEHHEGEGEMHDMHIDAEKGHMSGMVVTPTTPGTYQLVCSYEGHTDQGQKATLIVE